MWEHALLVSCAGAAGGWGGSCGLCFQALVVSFVELGMEIRFREMKRCTPRLHGNRKRQSSSPDL